MQNSNKQKHVSITKLHKLNNLHQKLEIDKICKFLQKPNDFHGKKSVPKKPQEATKTNMKIILLLVSQIYFYDTLKIIW